jgi:hypothetical protein
MGCSKSLDAQPIVFFNGVATGAIRAETLSAIIKY